MVWRHITVSLMVPPQTALGDFDGLRTSLVVVP
jgi:hypothetical protein